MRPLLLALALTFTGCVSLPKATVDLNEAVSVEVDSAEKAHLALVEEYGSQRRGRADDFVLYAWAPSFIEKFLEKIDFGTAVCEVQGKRDRALEVQEVVSAISKQIEKRRASLHKAIRKAENKLKRGIRAHYKQIATMYSAVTTNLRTVSERLDAEKMVRDFAGKQVNKVMPLDEMTGKLEDLFKEPK